VVAPDLALFLTLPAEVIFTLPPPLIVAFSSINAWDVVLEFVMANETTTSRALAGEARLIFDVVRAVTTAVVWASVPIVTSPPATIVESPPMVVVAVL